MGSFSLEVSLSSTREAACRYKLPGRLDTKVTRGIRQNKLTCLSPISGEHGRKTNEDKLLEYLVCLGLGIRSVIFLKGFRKTVWMEFSRGLPESKVQVLCTTLTLFSYPFASWGTLPKLRNPGGEYSPICCLLFLGLGKR